MPNSLHSPTSETSLETTERNSPPTARNEVDTARRMAFWCAQGPDERRPTLRGQGGALLRPPQWVSNAQPVARPLRSDCAQCKRSPNGPPHVGAGGPPMLRAVAATQAMGLSAAPACPQRPASGGDTTIQRRARATMRTLRSAKPHKPPGPLGTVPDCSVPPRCRRRLHVQ